MGKLIRVLSTALLSAIGGFISIVSLETGFFTFLKTPTDVSAYIPCLSFLFATIMAYMSIKTHLNKDMTYIKRAVDDIKEKTIETRTIVQGEAARTRVELKSEFETTKKEILAAITAKSQAIGQNLSEPEILDLEQTINKILTDKNVRKAPARQALKAGKIEEAASRLISLGNQEAAASDGIGKSAAENFREAGELYYPFNTAKSLEAFKQAAKYDPNSFWVHIYLSRLYIRAGDLPNAVKFAEAGQATAKNDHDKSVALNERGKISAAQNNLAAARQFCQDCLEISQRLADADPLNAGYQRDLSVSTERLGDVAVAQNDLKAARQCYQDGLEISKKLADNDPSNTGYQRDLAVSTEKLGDVAVTQNNLEAARQCFQDCLGIFKTLADNDTSNAVYQSDLSVSYNKLGDVAVAQNDLKAARQFFQDGLDIAKKLANTDTSNAGYQRDFAFSHHKMASLGGKGMQGHWNEAYFVLKRLEDAGKLLPSDEVVLEMLRGKADVD